MPIKNRFAKRKSKQNRYIPERRNKNQWYLSNNEDMCKEIYEMGQRFMKLMNGPDKPRRHMQFPAILTKYFYFLFLTGDRAMEPILSKDLLLEVRTVHGINYIYVKQIVEKHMKWNGQALEREVVETPIPIFCEYERLMWKYITNSGQEMNAANVFRFNEWVKYDSKGRLRANYPTRYLRSFRVDLRDTQGTLHKNERITPHILRHSRAFNLLINHDVKTQDILGIMHWNSDQMLWYYAYLKRTFKFEDKLKRNLEQGYMNRKYNIVAPQALPIP